MGIRKRNWKKQRPKSLAEAFELAAEFATEQGKPPKRMADLMGVEIGTYYRWTTTDQAMPATRLAGFEHLAGCNFVSEWLANTSHKLVVDMPCGKKPQATDLNLLQGSFAETMGLLIRFYEGDAAVDETLIALTDTMTGLAWHRANVEKVITPELGLFEA